MTGKTYMPRKVYISDPFAKFGIGHDILLAKVMFRL